MKPLFLAAVLSAFVGSTLLAPRSGVAQETAAAAQLLFEQGRDLLRAGQSDQACPKLSESQRLGPATGTLLALAMCHEAQGKLASAWAEYAEVAIRAAREGHAPRETHARAKVAELKPRLSSLEVRIPAAVAAYSGVEVRRNGIALGAAAWNLPVPVDGGRYELQVTAPDRVTWRQTVLVTTERDAVVAEVPELGAQEAPPSAGPALERAAASGAEHDGPRTPVGSVGEAPFEAGSERMASGSDDTSTLAWSGLALGGAGVAAWLVGGGFFYAAYKQKGEYERPCDVAACESDRNEHYENARHYGNWATRLGFGGGALLITGVVLYWLHADTEPGAGAARLRVDVGQDRAFVGIVGGF